MNTLKKTVMTACAIATISFAALGATSTGASAGWKKHRHHHHFHGRFFKPHHYSYNYGYGYYCKPKYRKIWVWSPRKGRKVKRLVKVGKWCNGRYYNYY
ncbi:MAG: hypothetical protein JJ964_03120 [Rhizobiales bacterium]|nr:hypothetical protein [Hyphomicrobiales bacterium]